MKLNLRKVCGVIAGVVGVLFAAGVVFGKDSGGGKQPSGGTEQTKSTVNRTAEVAAARGRAKLLHDVYASTLEVLHHHYFRAEGAVLPARAMEDIFTEMDRLSKDKARWIAVNTDAMSIHHEPKTEFEKKAAAVLASGKGEYELVENGVYQRAGVIPLRSSCVSCHSKHFSVPPKTPRFAGLVISIPLNQKQAEGKHE